MFIQALVPDIRLAETWQTDIRSIPVKNLCQLLCEHCGGDGRGETAPDHEHPACCCSHSTSSWDREGRKDFPGVESLGELSRVYTLSNLWLMMMVEYKFVSDFSATREEALYLKVSETSYNTGSN